jgi:hypothetical protein
MKITYEILDSLLNYLAGQNNKVQLGKALNSLGCNPDENDAFLIYCELVKSKLIFNTVEAHLHTWVKLNPFGHDFIASGGFTAQSQAHTMQQYILKSEFEIADKKRQKLNDELIKLKKELRYYTWYRFFTAVSLVLSAIAICTSL